MPSVRHRMVGIMELETTRTQYESDVSLSARATAAAIRRIGFELAVARSKPRMAMEPTIRVDSVTLQQELEVELASLQAGQASLA